MTKAEIISFVQNNLRKIDKTNKYHPVVLEKAITIAFNQGYGEIFDADPRLLDNYTRTYGASGTPIAITADANTGIYTSTLPEEYVPFSDKNSGVRHIATEAISASKFFPVAKREFEILSNTLAGELSGEAPSVDDYTDERCYYVVRDTTVEYHITATTASNGVRMDIVIPFDKYLGDDVVIIPFAKDAQLISTVIDMLRAIPPVDLKDNNADIG